MNNRVCGIRSQPGGLLESEEGYGGGSHHSSTSLGKRDPQYYRVSRGFLGLQSRILVLGPSGGTASMPSVLETIKLHTAESSRLFYFVLFFGQGLFLVDSPMGETGRVGRAYHTVVAERGLCLWAKIGPA